MHVALSAVAGLLAGPLIHHVAVQAGADLPFGVGAGVCRRCGAPNSLLASCSSCGLRITRAIATALLTSILSGLIAMALGPVWVLIPYLGFAAMTVALFLTDVDHKRIPNRITYPGTPLLAGLLMLGAVADGTLSSFPRALLGALAYAGFFGMVYMVARGGFGFGDVKLAVSLGLFTGFLGWDRLLLAGMATAAVGGLVALAAVLGGSARAKSEIPYGPPMIVGTWISIIGGERLVQMLL